MHGKITHALLRKEADIYRSQGLPQESLRVYQELLESDPRLPMETQAAVRDQIQRLKIEIQCNSGDEGAILSDEHIELIRQGWSPEATPEEIIASAGSLLELGRYAEALSEFKALLRKGVAAERLRRALAVCLRQLHRPENVGAAVDRLASEVCEDSVAAGRLRVAVAEEFYQQGQWEYAVSLVLSLRATDRFLPPPLQKRLAALSERLSGSRLEFGAPEPKTPRDTACAFSAPGAGASRLRRVLQFVGRLAGGR